MTTWGFFKRRLVRLHPMVVMGTVIGACLYFFGQGDSFPLIGSVPGWKVPLAFVMGCLMIPCGTKMDIRGWGETNSFNGPNWSLTWEYLANVLYAFIFRRLPKIALGVLVILSASSPSTSASTSRRGQHPQRSVQLALHPAHLPADSRCWGRQPHNRQEEHEDMQLPRRALLPPLPYALPAYLYADQLGPLPSGRPALRPCRSERRSVHLRRAAGIRSAQGIRQSCPRMAQTPLAEDLVQIKTEIRQA